MDKLYFLLRDFPLKANTPLAYKYHPTRKSFPFKKTTNTLWLFALTPFISAGFIAFVEGMTICK